MSDDDDRDPDPVAIGTRYRVRFDDCCVSGAFTATVAELVHDDGSNHPEDAGHLDSIMFDNGVVLTEWLRVEFQEVQA